MTNSILHKLKHVAMKIMAGSIAGTPFSFAGLLWSWKNTFWNATCPNDDFVKAGMGFGTHPHDNMEIISIPLEGDLEHKDSMGNISVIRHGDIQVMSAEPELP